MSRTATDTGAGMSVGKLAARLLLSPESAGVGALGIVAARYGLGEDE